MRGARQLRLFMNADEAGEAKKGAREPVAFVSRIAFALALPPDVPAPLGIVQAVRDFPFHNPVTQHHHGNEKAERHRRPR